MFKITENGLYFMGIMFAINVWGLSLGRKLSKIIELLEAAQ